MDRPTSPRPTLRAAALALASTLAVALAACGGSDDVTTASGDNGGAEETTIRYQHTSGWVTPLELADELGYLRGLELTSTGESQGGPQDIQFVATKQIDIGSSFNGAIVKAIQSGARVTPVVASYGTDRDFNVGYYVLDDAPIRSARDLIGKKVGMNILGAHYEAALDEWLASEGLTPEQARQVERVVLPPGYSDQAIRERLVDVVALRGIVQADALSRGGIRELFDDNQLFGDATLGSLFLHPDFIAANPNTTRQLVGGIARAIDWLQRHPRDEAVALAIRAATRRDRPNDVRTLRYWRSLGVWSPGGTIAFEDVDRWRGWLERTGVIPEGSVDVRAIYTNEFNPYAGDAEEG